MESEELRLINAFYGFCIASDDWPSPLADIGYKPCGVERAIRVLLDGNDRTLVPDLICATPEGNHALCIEAKSRTVHEEQARKYLVMKSTSLLATGNLPPTIDPSALFHDVIYTASSENVSEIEKQLSELGLPFPVVLASNDIVALSSGRIKHHPAHIVFEATVDIAGYEWPSHYVPFTSKSTLGDIAPFAARAFAEFIINGASFTGDDIASKATPHWVQCGMEERKAIRDKLASLANEATAHELEAYIVRPGSPRAWKVVNRPSGYQALTRLRRVTDEFINRMKTGQPFAPSVIQMELFSFEAMAKVVDEEHLEDDLYSEE